MTEQNARDAKVASILLECDLDEPIEKVWRALSEPALLAKWLMPNDIRTETGARFTLSGTPEEGGAIECEILASDPPRRLSYSWRGCETRQDGTRHELDTVVTFELAPRSDGGTFLRVLHEGFAVPADYRFDVPAEEPEIVVLLPVKAIARRRLRKLRPVAFRRGAMPTVCRLAA